MSLTWKRIKRLSSSSIVDETLEKYGLQASQALLDCLKENNGGKPVPSIITATNGDEFDVKHLLSFNTSDLENFHLVVDFFSEHYGKTMIPFAIDSGSNYFCENDGQIIIWTQEDGLVIKVAESFDAFLRGLHE